ncbi:MAG: hypothetical protein ACK5V3_13650 [Bdellovibrionales bacterium]
MKFFERSYNSELIRPKPLIHQDEAGGLILIVTPWGSQEGAQKTLDFIVQHLMTVKQDQEHTSPFQKIQSLSDDANQLRQAAMMANDFIYRSVNPDSLELVVEVLFLGIQKKQVAWCQIGCPHLLLKKKKESLQPISCHPETRADLLKFPLPQYFLGADATVSPRCGDLQLDKGDEVILLSSSQLPTSLWSATQSSELEEWTDRITEVDSSQPFWLGRLKLD